MEWVSLQTGQIVSNLPEMIKAIKLDYKLYHLINWQWIPAKRN